jgi:hypothetical protein
MFGNHKMVFHYHYLLSNSYTQGSSLRQWLQLILCEFVSPETLPIAAIYFAYY